MQVTQSQRSFGLMGMIALALAAAVFVSCNRPMRVGVDPTVSIMTETRCLELAKEEFGKNGFAVGDYNVTVDAHNSDKDYLVWFEPKGLPYPGCLQSVIVDRASGRARFIPGK